eukprot:3508893-Ditylum_brightwellii.AAC.1
MDDYSVKIPKCLSFTSIHANDVTTSGFKSCLQGIGQPLDQQVWVKAVQNITTPHEYLVEASRTANFSLWCPSNDEPRKLVRFVAEGYHTLQD